MKLNSEFLIQDIGDETLLVPVGKSAEKYNLIVRLNSSAKFIVSCLTTDATREDILNALDKKYDATKEQLDSALDITLDKLRECGALVE